MISSKALLLFSAIHLFIPHFVACQSDISISYRPLSENQDFIVTDDSPNGEYVGTIQAYPEFVVIGENPTFKPISGDLDVFTVNSEGLITVNNHSKLISNNNLFSLKVLVSKTGYSETIIYITINKLKSTACTFFDLNASTNGIGTRAKPYNTFKAIKDNNLIYLFNRGTKFTLNGTIDSQGFNNILIGSYGIGNKPIIYASTNNNTPFKIGNGTNGFTVRDLEITSNSPDDSGSNWMGSIYGYAYNGAWKNIRVLHNDIHHCSGVALISNSPEPYAENATVEWNYIHDIPSDGVFIKNTKGISKINNNRIERINLNWNFVGHTEAEANGDGIQTYDVFETIVKHNYIDRTFTGNKFCIILDSRNNIEPVTVTDNYLVPTTSGDLKTWGVYVFFINGRISRNYFKGGEYGIYNGRNDSDIIIDYNIFDHCEMGIQDQNSKDYNNVFYGTNICLSYGGKEFKNNIVYFTSTGQKVYDYWNDITSDYNLYNQQSLNMFGQGRSTLQSQRPNKELNSTIGDPDFYNPPSANFKVKPESPAIGKGVFLADNIDYENLQVANPPNIGASDYNNINKPAAKALIFNVFPNPNNGAFLIATEYEQPVEMNYQIFDMSGKVLYISESIVLEGQTKGQLPYHLPGVFLLNIRSSSHNYSETHLISIN